MKKAIYILLVFFLFSCKAPKNITEDKKLDLTELKTSYYYLEVRDSLIELLRSILELEFEYRKIVYSEPDSVGKQHIQSEETLTGKGTKTDEKETKSGSEATVQQRDSSELKIKEDTHTVTKEQKNYWRQWKDKIITGICIAVVILIGILFLKRKK